MKAWQVWLDKNHLIGTFETKEEARAWVERYAPECKIKEKEVDNDNLG